jgi:hypothetical protein
MTNDPTTPEPAEQVERMERSLTGQLIQGAFTLGAGGAAGAGHAIVEDWLHGHHQPNEEPPASPVELPLVVTLTKTDPRERAPAKRAV